MEANALMDTGAPLDRRASMDTEAIKDTSTPVDMNAAVDTSRRGAHSDYVALQ